MNTPGASPRTLLLPNLIKAVFACCVSMAALSAGPSIAADELQEQARLSPFSLRLGVYDMNLNTEIRVDGRGGLIGTSLNFEDDLNLDDNKDTFDVAFRWRFADRHFLEAEYFRLKRNGSRRLEGEIRFGDEVFAIGSDINSSFTTEVTRLGYAYRIVRHRDWGLALGVGLHVTRLRAALKEITFDSVNLPIENQEIAAVTAPLPVFGFSGARRLGEKWALIVRGQFLSLEVDDIDGSIEHGAIQLEYDAADHFGFGFGYDWFVVDVESREDFWLGRAEVKFHGPMLYAKAYF